MFSKCALFLLGLFFTLQYDDQEHRSQLNDDSEEDEVEELAKTGSQEEVGEDHFHKINDALQQLQVSAIQLVKHRYESRHLLDILW